MLHMRNHLGFPAPERGKTFEITLRLHDFAAQHGKGLDKLPVSFQIFHSKRREGVPGKQFAREGKLTISETFGVAGTTWQISRAAD